MFYEVLGFRHSAGISKKTNKPYSGNFVFFKFARKGINGFAAFEKFVPDDMYTPQLGQTVRLIFDDGGYLVDVEVI